MPPGEEVNAHVFFAQLPREQVTKLYRSEGPEVNKDVARLQELFDKSQIDAYDKELKRLQKTGRQFRLTEGHVFEVFKDNPKEIGVPIQMTIKEGVLTWYFMAPHDQTSQEFRDETFLCAGLGHVNVDNAWFRYYRGSNAVHVEKMHTHEGESMFNHNHYILAKGQDFTPERLKQHLDGFVKAERELGYVVDQNGKKVEKILTQEEADEIVRQYTEHWKKITAKPDKNTPSILERCKELGQKRLTREDKHEWVKGNYQYNTVESEAEKIEGNVKELQTERETYLSQKGFFTIDPNWPLPKRIKAVLKAMRGGHSELAHTRQTGYSKYPIKPAPKDTNDAVNLDVINEQINEESNK
jgi:hypothetical protein